MTESIALFLGQGLSLPFRRRGRGSFSPPSLSAVPVWRAACVFSLCLVAPALLEGTLPWWNTPGIDLSGREVYIAEGLCPTTSKSTLALCYISFTVSSPPSCTEIPTLKPSAFPTGRS